MSYFARYLRATRATCLSCAIITVLKLEGRVPNREPWMDDMANEIKHYISHYTPHLFFQKYKLEPFEIERF